MPCWYYDKRELRETPSILEGLSFDTERRYRKEGARFIMNCGTNMGLGHNTMATGVVYFHRFYMSHSFKSFPRYVTACCCLFLAGKVEETPKKCRDIIKTARLLLADNYFYSFGEDPKEEVMTLERILLQTIKFDLQVEHPYTFLLKYAKCLKGDQQKLQKVVQMAWNFVNDSLSTVVCLQWEPEIIAVALIHLASKLSKFTVVDWVGRQPQQSRWWDMFVLDVTMEIIEDICHQVLDLYQNQKAGAETTPPSPPQKPPSRADSPQAKTTVAFNSPGTPQKVRPPPQPLGAGGPGGIIPHNGELSNIQTIKSLANPIPPMPPQLPNDAMSASSSAAAVAAAAGSAVMHSSYHHHMYAPPPPGMHSMYSTVPPPLPPPPLPYGGPPPATSWSPAMAPPPPMPPHYRAPLPAAPMPPQRPPAQPPHANSHNHGGGGGSAGSGYSSQGGGSSASYRQRY